MARGRAKALKRRRKRIPKDWIGPTPQTLARLQRDVIGWMASQKRLGPDQLRAAREIGDLLEAWERSLIASPVLDTAGRPKGRRAPRDPYTRLNDTEREIWRSVYTPWIEEMQDWRVGRSRVKASEIIIGVIRDNYGLSGLDAYHGLATGTSGAVVQRGLYRYAQIAGWIAPIGAT